MSGLKITTPTIRVPGLLSDEALQEQLAQTKQGLNATNSVTVPSAAVDMAERVQREFIDAPLNAAVSNTPAPKTKKQSQDRAKDVRSDILSEGVAGGAAALAVGGLGAFAAREGGILDELGTLSPEESQRQFEERKAEAADYEQSVKRTVETRRKLRGLTDEEAAQLGIPSMPGVDPAGAREIREQQEINDQQRIVNAEQATADANVQAPTKAWWLNSIRNYYSGLTGIATGVGKSVAIGLWELPGEMSGIREGGKSDLRNWFETVDETVNKLMPKDVARQDDFATVLSQGAGSMVGFMLGGFIGTQIGLPAKAATTILGAANGGAGQYEDAEKFGAAGVQRLLSFIAGAGLGATEAIPINRALMRLETTTGGTISRMLQTTAASSMEEFLQEVGQNLGEDVVAKVIYDEQREFDVKDYLKAGAAGAVLGGVMGGATATLQSSGIIQTPTGPTQEQQDEEARAAVEAQRQAFLEQMQLDLQVQFDQITGVPAELQAPAEADAALQQEGVAFDPNAAAEIINDVASGNLTLEEGVTVVADQLAQATRPTELAMPARPAGVVPEQIAERLLQGPQRPATQVAEEFVAELEREPQIEQPTQQAAGGTVPAGEKIILRHFASEPRAELDPDMQGTGPLRGQERARLAGDSSVNRTYYGVNSGPDYVPPKQTAKEYAQLTKEERAAAKRLEKAGVSASHIRQALEARYRQEASAAGYRNEGLGDVMHEVEVDPNDLYNMDEDPLGIRETLTADSPTGRLTEYERKVKEAGFKGAYFPTSQLGATAILFEKATPTSIKSERYNLPLDQIAQPTDFDQITPETFQKGGWAVLTPTQESQGAFDSEANQAEHERFKKLLKREGIKYKVVQGAYQGTPQGDNYLIFAPETKARELGAKFKQESILTRDGLVYTDGTNRFVPGNGVIVGPEAAQQDFYSQMEDGTAWTMNLDFDAMQDPAAQPEMLAATSRGRNAFTGEPTRDEAGVAGRGGNGNDIGLSQIADNFRKLLDLVVRTGRFTVRNAAGQYSTRSDVIRLRSPNDLSTLVHEGAHSLEFREDYPLGGWIRANDARLQQAAQDLYGGDVARMDDDTRRSEGFAEFFRIYTLNRPYAATHYPELVDSFDNLLEQQAPELREGLRLIGDQYAAWLQMPSQAVVSSMIVSGRQTVGVNKKLQEMRENGMVNWFRESVNGLFTSAINRNNNLNRLVADILNIAEADRGQALDLKRAEDPRALIRMASNTGSRAMVQLTDGVLPYRGTVPVSRSIRDVMLTYHGQPLDGNLSAVDETRQRDFATYIVALRGIDEYNRYAQGIIARPPVAATLGDLQMTVSELEAQYGEAFKAAAQMINDYAMALWEKSYRAGLISKETYLDGQTRNFYVPLQRDLSDKDISQAGASVSAKGGRSIVKRFRGSDRDIIDPVDALVEKTFALEKVIAENEVKKALATLADRAGQVGALVERIPAQRLLGTEYSVKDIARQLTRDETLSEADAEDLMRVLEASIEEGNRVALFRSQQAQAAGENIVFFWEKGKLAALQIKDGDIGADVVNVLNSVGTENMPLFVDLIAYPSTMFRAAVTSWPDFLLVNFIRDQMSAFVLTEGYTPFVTGIRGMGDEIRQGRWASEYNAAMGIMGGMNTSTLHDARVRRDIGALRNKGYVARVFGQGEGIAGAAKGLARVTELSETGTRLGIYRATYERAIADGLTPWEASVEASYIATDYIDFGLHGNRMGIWRRMVPFLNAQLQGLYKMMRVLGADEVRQRKGLMFAVTSFFKDVNGLELSRAERQAVRIGRKAWLKMASLGLIGAALHAAFSDDPDYQDTSEYLRTTGWVIPIGDGQIIYIPKPFELAMVSNIVERGLEAASGDKEAKNRLLRGMAMNLVPPTNPPAIQMLVEQQMNYDSFGGREIVPDYMRALEPELQYNHYTSELAKSLGRTFGWSPMRIDHALSSMGASAYRDLTTMYNMTDPNRPSSDVTEWPITRRFVRDARRGSASAKDFWKMASTVDGSLRRAEQTYKNYVEAGRDGAAQQYLRDLDPDEQAYALLNTHFKTDYKRLNPVYRTRQLTTIVSALRRELYSDLGVENSGPGGLEDPFMLSAKEKADVDKLLSEYARREVRNSMVYMKAPGWGNKAPLPTEPTIELLRATNPLIAEEFERRVKKAKVYSGEFVRENWPEVRDRLLTDGPDAFLKDIVTVAKVLR